MADTAGTAAAPTTAHAEEKPPGWTLARVHHIPIRVSGGALVLAAWLTLVYHGVLANRSPGQGTMRWLDALLFPAAFVASILLHEAGHAAAGRRCGLQVRWVVVDGLGGETEFDRDAAGPGAAFLVAAAGPGVSAGLAAALTAAAHLSATGTVANLLLTQIALGNTLIAAFNLLPGLPLDGGHLLRAAVWKATGSPRIAAMTAAAAGLALACAIVVVPLVLALAAGAQLHVFGVTLLLLVAGPLATQAWSILRHERRTTALIGSEREGEVLPHAGRNTRRCPIPPATSTAASAVIAARHGAARWPDGARDQGSQGKPGLETS